MKISQTECEVLVIGGGGAGVTAAIAAAKAGAHVTLVNQGPVARTGLTPMTGGGIQVVHGLKDPQDSVDIHFRDIVTRGHYLGDQNLIEAVAYDGPERIDDLQNYGAKLIHNRSIFSTAKTPLSGYSFLRGYLLLGSTMMKVLRREALRHPEITFLEDWFIFSLLTVDNEVTGALCLDMRKGEFRILRSPAVILATGGAGELYSFTTNRPQKISGNARGTGYALALQAGARLVDMEMTQFYPATPVWPPAIWGIHCGIIEIFVTQAGAKILNAQGKDFLEYPLVRDRTARRIYQEIKAGLGTPAGGVLVDITKSNLPVEQYTKLIKDWVPAYKQYTNLGIDTTKGPFEAAPALHFQIGGVRINEQAETSLRGLYAAGEVSGNTHGANRLAGGAVPELLVFANRAGKNAARRAAGEQARETDQAQVNREMEKVAGWLRPKKDRVPLHEIRDKLGRSMYENVGILRSADGMTKGLEEIEELAREISRIQVSDSKTFNLGLVDAKEIELMIDTARAIATSALIRKESRGAHYREDYPETDYENWTKHVVLEKKDDRLNPTLEPVNLTRIKPPETKP